MENNFLWENQIFILAKKCMYFFFIPFKVSKSIKYLPSQSAPCSYPSHLIYVGSYIMYIIHMPMRLRSSQAKDDENSRAQFECRKGGLCMIFLRRLTLVLRLVHRWHALSYTYYIIAALSFRTLSKSGINACKVKCCNPY